ncbi:unnamed protein product [Spirodela intermedia]|uniref:Cysteine proteinase inhibitor n=1 Tax=Spirodela intermedia TaxID=51605 RepID=A0A7I8IYG2_SPIIN|nr:unnamed protein product [Spirodela intermedia]CAA6662183.1 unnamed protein product [Spirodela intermedia]
MLTAVAFLEESRNLFSGLHISGEESGGGWSFLVRLWNGRRRSPRMSGKVGGAEDVGGAENGPEIEELARFAVDEYNKQQNGLLEFSRVVKAKTQVVSGIMHHLTVEVKEGGVKKLYDAKVWVQGWLNSKKLHDFKQIGILRSLRSSLIFH